jgi:hypothetical protein
LLDTSPRFLFSLSFSSGWQHVIWMDITIG